MKIYYLFSFIKTETLYLFSGIATTVAREDISIHVSETGIPSIIDVRRTVRIHSSRGLINSGNGEIVPLKAIIKLNLTSETSILVNRLFKLRHKHGWCSDNNWTRESYIASGALKGTQRSSLGIIHSHRGKSGRDKREKNNERKHFFRYVSDENKLKK